MLACCLTRLLVSDGELHFVRCSPNVVAFSDHSQRGTTPGGHHACADTGTYVLIKTQSGNALANTVDVASQVLCAGARSASIMLL